MNSSRSSSLFSSSYSALVAPSRGSRPKHRHPTRFVYSFSSSLLSQSSSYGRHTSLTKAASFSRGVFSCVRQMSYACDGAPVSSSVASPSSRTLTTTVAWKLQLDRPRPQTSYFLLASKRYRYDSLLMDATTQIGPAPEPKQEDPTKPPNPLKSPVIPEGHPIDTDGRPLGHIIPDYDVEVPAFSYGGYAKDFDAWTEPPVFPDTVWPKIAKYNYAEMETKEFPVMYEVDVVRVINILAVLGFLISIIATQVETNRYYAKYAEYYSTGWPFFHYSPNLDIVPLTERSDGLPPETPFLLFNDPAMLHHEVNDEESDSTDD